MRTNVNKQVTDHTRTLMALRLPAAPCCSLLLCCIYLSLSKAASASGGATNHQPLATFRGALYTPYLKAACLVGHY